MHEPQIVTDGGPWAFHDYACPVCHETKAILLLHKGVFMPCDQCQEDGWAILRLPKWLRKRVHT